MPTLANKQIGPIGYGLLPLTIPPHFPTEDHALVCLHTAVKSDLLLWNAAEFYGTPTYNSLVLLNRFFTKYPEDAEKVLVHVKGALLPSFEPNGDPKFIRRSVENCLALLGGKAKIDVFEIARIDHAVELEVQLGTLKALVDEGKIGSVGLTEVSAETIRKAVRIVPIAAVEIELSLWCTDALYNGILETCGELGIPVLAYCPVGRGVLTGSLQSFDDIPEGDLRRMLPRYQPENLEINLKLVQQVQKIAEKKSCTAAQVALGWLLALQNQEGMPPIIPIPGTASIEHIRENAAAEPLTKEEMEAVDSILKTYPVAGDRYHEMGMKFTNL